MLIDLQKEELCAQAGLEIPLTDAAAWLAYPAQRWVQDKLQLAQRLGIPSAPLGVWPSALGVAYPVICKPIINLFGMGADAERVDSDQEYQRALDKSAGRCWMPFFSGEHHSVDCVLFEGEVVWHCAWRGHPTEPWSGAFDRWETLPAYALGPSERQLIALLGGWTGCLNIELIGGNVIEAHLRMGDLHHLHSVPLFRQIAAALHGAPMSYTVPKLFQIPVFQPIDAVCGDVGELDLTQLCGECRLVYLDPPPHLMNNPPGRVRRCLLVAANLEAGLAARQATLKQLAV